MEEYAIYTIGSREVDAPELRVNSYRVQGINIGDIKTSLFNLVVSLNFDHFLKLKVPMIFLLHPSTITHPLQLLYDSLP